MDIKTLKNIPPWDWPEGIDTLLLEILRDDQAGASDRLLAAELAGDYTVINDDLAGVLLSIARNSEDSEDIRAKAAISMGPALEHVDLEGFVDEEDVLISQKVFHQIQEAFQALYMDPDVPMEVRRRVLEASVRAPQDWHQDAVRIAYLNDDENWKLTAVFCMCYIGGFEEQILEALGSENPDTEYEAVRAAGNWEVAAAWPHISNLVTSDETGKGLLLAAIEVAIGISPSEAPEILNDLTDSDDEDIVEAAHEALAMAEAMDEDSDYDEDDDDDEIPR